MASQPSQNDGGIRWGIELRFSLHFVQPDHGVGCRSTRVAIRLFRSKMEGMHAQRTRWFKISSHVGTEDHGLGGGASWHRTPNAVCRDKRLGGSLAKKTEHLDEALWMGLAEVQRLTPSDERESAIGPQAGVLQAASAEGLGQQWRRGQDDVKTRVPSFLGEAGALWLLMGRLLREWDQPLGLDFFVHTLQVSPEGQCTILEAVGEDLLQGALWIQVFLHRLKRAVQTTRQVARRVGAGKPSEQRISIGRMHLLRIDLVNAPFDRDDRGCDQDCCPSGSTLRCNSWQCPHPISGSATSSSVLVH